MKGELPRRTAAEGVRLEADGVSGSCQLRGDLFRVRTFFLGMYVGTGIGFRHRHRYVHHPIYMYAYLICMNIYIYVWDIR